MMKLSDILKAMKGTAPADLHSVLYTALLRNKSPLPSRSHYITADGKVFCTNSGLRYAVKE